MKAPVKKPVITGTLSFMTTAPATRLRIEYPKLTRTCKTEYVWRPGNKRMTREKIA